VHSSIRLQGLSHFFQLLVFSSHVPRGHFGDQVARPAIEQSRRSRYEFRKSMKGPACLAESLRSRPAHTLLGGQISVELNPLSMFLQRSARVVKNLARQRGHRAVDHHRLMHVSALPAAAAAVEEAQLVVRIPPECKSSAPGIVPAGQTGSRGGGI